VSADALTAFFELVQGHEIEIGPDIRESIDALSNEFDFHQSSGKVEDRLKRLRERVSSHSRLLAAIRQDLGQFGALERLAAELNDEMSQVVSLRQELDAAQFALNSGLEMIRDDGSFQLAQIRSDVFPDRELFWPCQKQMLDRFMSRIDLTAGVVSLAMLGSSGVGKTYLYNCWSGSATGETAERSTTVKGKVIQLHLSDQPPWTLFRSRLSDHVHNADGILILYAIDDRKSFKAVTKALSQVREWKARTLPPPVLVVGWDKRAERRMVPASEGRALAERERAFFMEWHAEQSEIDAGIVKFLEVVSS
jgi:hypothetical protein